MAERLAAENVGLSLRWGPRLQDEEADALTNECFVGFTLSLRVETRLEDLKVIALDMLIGQVGELMAEIADSQVIGSSCGLPSSEKQRLREVFVTC